MTGEKILFLIILISNFFACDFQNPEQSALKTVVLRYSGCKVLKQNFSQPILFFVLFRFQLYPSWHFSQSTSTHVIWGRGGWIKYYYILLWMFWLSKPHCKFQSHRKILDMEILYSCPQDLVLLPMKSVLVLFPASVGVLQPIHPDLPWPVELNILVTHINKERAAVVGEKNLFENKRIKYLSREEGEGGK